MGESKISGYDFIFRAFSPTLTVVSSSDAEDACQRNNLSFAELIKPFCTISQDVQFRDPNNIPITVKNLRLAISDPGAIATQAVNVKKNLNEAVSSCLHAEEIQAHVSTDMYELVYQANTPWFDAYRDTLLANIPPAEHEFLSHSLGCIYVVSSSNPDVMETFNKYSSLNLNQPSHPNRTTKWFCSQIFKYYVLLHDYNYQTANAQKADTILTGMRSYFGANKCHLLIINSLSPETVNSNETSLPDPWAQHFSANSYIQRRYSTESGGSTVDSTPPNSPTESAQHPLDKGWNHQNGTEVDVIKTNHVQKNTKVESRRHGQLLSVDDHNRLRVFMTELVNRALMPWVEATMKTLNDQIASKMKSKGFLGGAKKWFAVSSAAKPGGAPGQPGAGTSVVYAADAPELQMRRYADLSFLFQEYEVAYQAYQQLKKDFQNDNAWLHYAGTLEMAALSAFMQEGTSQRNYPHHCMETAINTYLTTCKNPLLATRTTFLSAEALKVKRMYVEAAVQFIKMTTEDSDLRGALLLEQAAHCYLRTPRKPQVRKFAFHLVLAASRYAKAGQRGHSLRCYHLALRLYEGRGWSLAEDNINLNLCKHSSVLHDLEAAQGAASNLLRSNSRQSPAQQAFFLKEYIAVFKQYISSLSSHPDACLINDQLPLLHLPIAIQGELKILLGRPVRQLEDMTLPARGVQFQDPDLHSPAWADLEKRLLSESRADFSSMTFRPYLPCLAQTTPNDHYPVAVVGEPLTYQVPLKNPTQIPLILTDINLLWDFILADDEAQISIASLTESKSSCITNEVEKEQIHFAKEAVTTEIVGDFSLLPGERKFIELALIPKKIGMLKVKGLALTLSAQSAHDGSAPVGIRGKLPLVVRGPRMNKRPEEKLRPVYGEDRRLQVLVAPPMPQLQLSFLRFPSYMQAGEVRRISIKVTNTGMHPLTKLKLACPTPRNFTFGFDEFSDNLIDAAVFQEINKQEQESCRAYSPVQQKTCVNIPINVPGQVPGVLHPGSSVTVTCWLRAQSNPGAQTVSMLFFYESTEPNPLMRHRVLRHVSTIEILSTLTASCNLCLNHGSLSSSVIVSLEVTNHSQSSNAQYSPCSGMHTDLLQITALSPRYKINPITVSKDTKITLQAGEVFSLSLGLEEIGVKMQPSASGLFLSDVTFHRDNSTKMILASGSPVADMVESPQGTLATLLLFWKLGTEYFGFLEIPIADFISDSGRLEQSTAFSTNHLLPDPVHHLLRQSKLIRVSMVYSSSVKHNFQQKKLCCVPVSIFLYNNCDEHLLIRLDSGETRTTNHSAAAFSYVWVGFSGKVLELQPRCRSTVQMTAAFTSPGVFDLQSLTLRSAQRPTDANTEPVFFRHELASSSYLIEIHHVTS